VEKQTLFWRILQRLILGSASKNKVSILTFHRVLQNHDPLRPSEPCAPDFDRLVRFLSSNFELIKLDKSVLERQSSDRPYRVILTFDDGYADNFDIAYPILKKYDVPAVFFVASGMLDGGIMWNDMLIETFRSIQTPSINLSELGLGDLRTSNMAEKRASVLHVIRKIKYLDQNRREEIVDRIPRARGNGAGQQCDDDSVSASAPIVRLT
jgi:hypothetical protein